MIHRQANIASLPTLRPYGTKNGLRAQPFSTNIASLRDEERLRAQPLALGRFDFLPTLRPYGTRRRI
jgi:hypothetical protein